MTEAMDIAHLENPEFIAFKNAEKEREQQINEERRKFMETQNQLMQHIQEQKELLQRQQQQMDKQQQTQQKLEVYIENQHKLQLAKHQNQDSSSGSQLVKRVKNLQVTNNNNIPAPKNNQSQDQFMKEVDDI